MTWWQRLHQRFHGHENFLLILLLILGGTAGGVTVARTVPGPPPLPSSPPVMACQITDQDGHIYHPERLQVLSSCITVTGTVVRILSEADGDDHIRVEPDTAYINLLRPANVNQSGCTNGCLVVEPVCEHAVTQADAVAACQADVDPLTPLPQVGQHVWMEGRYVIDLQHGGWSELHPLYRWGVLP
jgi:hypothetical protein